MKIQHPITVCYFGTYRQEYNRNIMMIDGLRLNGVRVIECHERLWHGIEDRIQVTSGGWLSFQFIRRIIKTYWRLILRFTKIEDFDILIVGYPGQFDVFLARFLSFFKRERKPIVWDVFMSIYLIALERGLDKKSKFTVRLLRSIERLALHIPDLLIHDTVEYVEWLCDTHKVENRKFRLVPTGADDRVYMPLEIKKSELLFIVTYYGTYIPNHGTQYIMQAIELLRTHPGIQFNMIGAGPELNSAQNFARDHQLTNVHFIQWLGREELVRELNKSEILLGAFGTTPQSLMTIQNKIYEGLAIGKPVITGDSPTVRNHLHDRQEVYLCERENAHAIRDAIIDLYTNERLRIRLSIDGHEKFKNEYSITRIGAKYQDHLCELLDK